MKGNTLSGSSSPSARAQFDVAAATSSFGRHVRKLIDEGEIEAHHVGSAGRITRRAPTRSWRSRDEPV